MSVVTEVTNAVSLGPEPNDGCNVTVMRFGVMPPEGKPDPVTLTRVTPGSAAAGEVAGLNVTVVVTWDSSAGAGVNSRHRKQLRNGFRKRMGVLRKFTTFYIPPARNAV